MNVLEQEEENEEGSIDEAYDEEEYEDPLIDCVQEQECLEDADVLNTEAEVEDLGKRKGTN